MGLGWHGHRVGTSLDCRHSFTDVLTLPGSLLLTFTCCLVAKSGPILCDPMDCSPPGSSAHGIPQARILEWVAISFSMGSSQPRDGTNVSCLDRRILYC